MLPIFVVNNHGQFNHLIHRKLRDMDIEVRMIPNTTAPSDVEAGCSGIVLGGGPSLERAGNCAEYLDLGLPVLGICLGLHVIATARGGQVGPGSHGGYGGVTVEITGESEILAGYEGPIHVWASHADEVKQVPDGFVVHARSDICPVEAMGSADERIYGVQWHPEVSHTENGDLLFRNFERICGE
ncbi:GMP synthase subunit A [Methanofollis fontis]|uniref:GMP synthase [glutamine-hydrolyzing] subunit A n=1 Tax=Methanofollis fontis TaxID=2052832 RepID=A0A483CXU3_9EURY|nr:GMP synthase subunit A [Methanofollis fontis]TAJ44193.1 GMP synthase [Methanofollis fontis]